MSKRTEGTLIACAAVILGAVLVLGSRIGAALKEKLAPLTRALAVALLVALAGCAFGDPALQRGVAHLERDVGELGASAARQGARPAEVARRAIDMTAAVAERVGAPAQAVTIEEWESDREALARKKLVEIVGEALKAAAPVIRAAVPSPWGDLVGIGIGGLGTLLAAWGARRASVANRIADAAISGVEVKGGADVKKAVRDAARRRGVSAHLEQRIASS